MSEPLARFPPRELRGWRGEVGYTITEPPRDALAGQSGFQVQPVYRTGPLCTPPPHSSLSAITASDESQKAHPQACGENRLSDPTSSPADPSSPLGSQRSSLPSVACVPLVKSHRRLWEKNNSEGAKDQENRPGNGRSWEASGKEKTEIPVISRIHIYSPAQGNLPSKTTQHFLCHQPLAGCKAQPQGSEIPLPFPLH